MKWRQKYLVRKFFVHVQNFNFTLFFDKYEMNNLLRLFHRGTYGTLSRMRYYSPSGNDSGKSGAIREAGGAFAKRETAKEDEFFYRQQKEQIAKLKDTITDEIKFHEEQIKRHMEAIERNKKKVEEISKEK